MAIFQFTDQSSATRAEKARRFLKALANDKDYRYFHGDGYPKFGDLHNDASAALEVFDEITQQSNTGSHRPSEPEANEGSVG